MSLTTNLYDRMVAGLYDHHTLCTPITPEIVTAVYAGDLYIENGYIYEDLDTMPFDAWDEDTWSFVHATGRAYWDGAKWWNEYEDENGRR